MKEAAREMPGKNTSCSSFCFDKAEINTIALLRVLATLGVLFVHINQRQALPGVWGAVASYGADGVKYFFLLTGMLVMYSWKTRKSTKDYWRKRWGDSNL